jgi:hypothetical protein
MKVNRRICSLAAMAILSVTASVAQQVKTDYDRNVDFGRYRTYCWQNVHTTDPLWVDRTKAAVDSELAAKGWTKVESGGDPERWSSTSSIPPRKRSSGVVRRAQPFPTTPAKTSAISIRLSGRCSSIFRLRPAAPPDNGEAA